jgi:hypothetical protein
MTVITATSRENITGSPAARAAGLVKTHGKAETVVTRQPSAPRRRLGFIATAPDVALFPRRGWAQAAGRTAAAVLPADFPAGHAAGGTP